MWQAGATLHRGAGATLHRSARASHYRGLSLPSTGSRRTGSVIVAHGPSCSVACGIFPDQGSNPCPLHWQADSQPLRHQGSPVYIIFIEGWWLVFVGSFQSTHTTSTPFLRCSIQRLPTPHPMRGFFLPFPTVTSHGYCGNFKTKKKKIEDLTILDTKLIAANIY